MNDKQLNKMYIIFLIALIILAIIVL